MIANELSQIYGFKTSIIPYVLTWDGVVTKYHDMYIRRLEISDWLEAYIQSLVLKKTLESISLEFRRNGGLKEFLSVERTACAETKLEKTELEATLEIAKD